MIFLTSISPKHIYETRQQECVKSWLKHGEVISFNHESEIELLKSQGYDEGVKFVPTVRTQKEFFGKHYVSMNALIDYVSENKISYACMINSDIELTQSTDELEIIKKQMESSFVYLHRWDFKDSHKDAHIYKDGVDAFFFTTELAARVPQTIFCLGQTFFDIWIPFHFLINKVPIISFSSRPIIYHKIHQAQYSQGNWHFMGNFTGMLIGMAGSKPQEVSKKIYNTLRNHTNYI